MNIADLPKTMRAFVLTGHGDMDKLVYKRDWPVPELNDNDVLIKVHACGLNNTDVNTRVGWYSKGVGNDPDPNDAKSEDAGWGGTPLRFPRIQGADVVGTVVATGKNAPAALMGCRVMVAGTWFPNLCSPFQKTSFGRSKTEAIRQPSTHSQSTLMPSDKVLEPRSIRLPTVVSQRIRIRTHQRTLA